MEGKLSAGPEAFQARQGKGGLPQERSQAIVQRGRVERGVVGQVRPLQAVPKLFDRIQLRSIAGQRHRLQPRRCHEFRGGTVHFPAVPDDDDAAADVVVQIAEEGGDVLGLEVAVLPCAEEQAEAAAAWRERQRGHHRHLLPVPAADGEDGRLAFGSQRATDEGIQQEAGLIDENNGGPLAARLF